MANILAAQTGVWSATSTWTGGVLPGVNDVAVANGKTVTIDQDISLVALDNTTAGGATAGGGFVITSAPRTVTLSEGLGNVSATRIGAAGALLTVSAAGAITINASSKGGGTGNGYRSLDITSALSVVTLTGSATGNYDTAYGVNLTAAATLTVGGNVVGGPSGLTGNHGIQCTAAGANITVLGNVSNGAGNPGYGVNMTQASTLTVIGSVTSGGNVAAVNSTHPSAVIDVQGAATAATGAPALSAAGLSNRFRTLVDAPNGRKAVYAPGWLMQSGTLCTQTIRDDLIGQPFVPSGTPIILSNYTSASPAPSNVRAGKVYGPSNTLTGTMAVPTADKVSVGVPVDASIGTAAISLKDLAAITGAQIAEAVGA